MKTHAVYATLLLAACGGPVGIEQGSTIVDSGLALAPSRGGIIGIVVDAQGRAVPSAHVFTQPRGFEATADIKGRFELPWLPPSELILVAGARGWEPGTSEQVAVVAGGIAEVEIVLGDRQRQGVVTVTVTNSTGEEHLLRDVDLGTGYHQGFEVLDTEPSLSDFFEGAATGDLNLRFETPVPAGTTQDVTIELLPIEAGRWSGTVDICFDNASRCIEQPISTLVD